MPDEIIAPFDADSRAGETPSSGGTSGGCVCGDAGTDELPELDARAIPHTIRHAAIFGALDGIAPGAGLVLVTPHDPLGLLAQLEQRAPHTFDVEYLERGPKNWRLSLTRKAA